uniref:Uncharacterized protein n=1 Tax=viral metagenome TaxID=1070528 RepID=A0A6C0LMW6_9ZZZZ
MIQDHSFLNECKNVLLILQCSMNQMDTCKGSSFHSKDNMFHQDIERLPNLLNNSVHLDTHVVQPFPNQDNTFQEGKQPPGRSNLVQLLYIMRVQQVI